MLVNTARFGEVEIDESLVITFPKGILGFSSDTAYCILKPNEDGAFYWLQSTQTPELAFVITNPNIFIEDYDVPVRADQADDLRLTNLDDAQVFVIVNKIGDTLTANLQGPIVCNTEARIAEQFVLAERRWTTRHPIMEIQPDSTAGASPANADNANAESPAPQRIPA